MDDAQIYQELANIFRDVFHEDGMIVRPDLTSTEVSRWDSLGHIRLVLAVEKAFRIKFLASEISNLKSAGDVAQLIRRKL